MSWCTRNWFCDLIGAALAVLIVAWALSLPAWAAPPPDWTTRYPVRITRVIDGDTVEALVTIWPGQFVTTNIRVFGVDTPELHSPKECERARAQEAKKYVEGLVAIGGDATIENVMQDKYGGRMVAVVRIGGVELAGQLIRQGLAVPYLGGTKQKGGWCA